MDLFSQSILNQISSVPLAEKIRPQKMSEIIGQDKAIGPGSIIQKFLKTGRLPSLILWGPPGTGKTTFALSLAHEINSEFVSVNAIEIGTKGLKEIGDQAKERLKLFGRSTILFVDEIHRFNKSQQDVLLPYVEKGDFTLIGATTENPAYEINRALISRCRIIIFQRLSDESLNLILERGLERYEKNKNYFDRDLKNELVRIADGDGRKLLNLLESILAGLSQSNEEVRSEYDNSQSLIQKTIGLENVSQWLSKETLAYDKNSDFHYDIISAFIKSIRGSDPDAALYYFARMLEGGEDPVFIARRLMILASEDVGNADPKALPLAVAGFQAVEAIGLPECAINLSQVITYLATAPKSNRSYKALNHAKEFVQNTGSQEIPLKLRSSMRSTMRDLGYGKGYIYPHDEAKGWVEQSYWPEKLEPQKFYTPSQNGYEKHIHAYIDWLKSK